MSNLYNKTVPETTEETMITNGHMNGKAGNKLPASKICNIEINDLKSVLNDNGKHDHASLWDISNSDKYRILVENSIDIITILDKKGIILFISPNAEKILGHKGSEILGENVFDYVHPDDLSHVMKTFFEGLLNPGMQINVELRFRKPDGSYTYLESAGTNYLNDPGINAIVVNSRDITHRKLTETDNQMLMTAVEQSYESIVITGTDGNINYVNKKFEEVTGYSRDEVIGKNPRVLKSGYTTDADYKDLWGTITSGKVWEGEFKNKKKNGEYYWESARITPVRNENGKIISFMAIKDDISALKKREEDLIKALDEKEIMLKEIHHRVKNNLQVISSLLKLQSETVNDPVLKDHLRVSRNRIKSMALIHQQLFNSKDIRNIDIEDYLFSLSGQIYSAFNISPEKIGIKISAKNIRLNVETAVPFGIILNELITNSLKHAFLKRPKGIIEIIINKSLIDGSYKLIYKDNGVGLPCELINSTKESSGLFLIKALINQLEGNVEITNNMGTVFEIDFKGINNERHPVPEVKTKHENPLYRKPNFIPFTMLV